MGYHGKYLNNPNMGRPKLQSDEERFWSKVRKTDTCWEWIGGLDRDGYGLIGIGPKQWRAHRFSMSITKGLDSTKPVVMHLCDNPLCVNPEHLKNATIKENNDDKRDKRRHAHLLTDDEVRWSRSSKLSRKELAKKFGVSTITIHHILHKNYYRHII